jgi:hypothetical protein
MRVCDFKMKIKQKIKTLKAITKEKNCILTSQGICKILYFNILSGKHAEKWSKYKYKIKVECS